MREVMSLQGVSRRAVADHSVLPRRLTGGVDGAHDVFSFPSVCLWYVYY